MIAAKDPLGFDMIRDMLADKACTAGAKEKIAVLAPFLAERELRSNLDQTSQARRILDALGLPPLSSMTEMEKIFALLQGEGLLSPAQLLAVAQFLASSRRMESYLKRADYLEQPLSTYRYSLMDVPQLTEEIERCIRGEEVDSNATKQLRDVRLKIEQWKGQVKSKLVSMLQKNKLWFSDGMVVQRGGRQVLPVKKQFKNQVPGAVVDMSASGSTYFIEPASVAKLQEELSLMEIEEENEVRRILYQLSAMAQDALPALRNNRDALEVLDFAFAKAKLSADMEAVAPIITLEKTLNIVNGHHPLLEKENCVPLNIVMGGEVRGVVITGPNTGGKTVALKTVGLLCLMAQCGLHVPADEGTVLPMRSAILCDIGDGQSISENLSTFSAHMTNILDILARTTGESLVLLDELGSGTDPAEGMGIAIAILEELRERGCLMVITTHYPEVKEYAQRAEGLINARMAFDRESLRPLYRLEIGEAGESCALHIAKRLGFSTKLLKRAHDAAYGARESAGARREEDNKRDMEALFASNEQEKQQGKSLLPPRPKIQREEAPKEIPQRARQFRMGDSVLVYPGRKIGLVYDPCDEQGQVGVQIHGKKQRVPYKRLKLHVSAESMYPDDYDFSIVFDTVANRKARHQMDRKYAPDAQIVYEKEERR